MKLRSHKALQGRDVLGKQRPAHLGLDGNACALKQGKNQLCIPVATCTAHRDALTSFKHRKEPNWKDDGCQEAPEQQACSMKQEALH